MPSNAKPCNPMSFCCICYLSVLCIICGPKSLRWPPGDALCYLFVRTFLVFLLHVLGCVLERFWMHLCSFFCICSLVVLPLGFVFRDKFERLLQDLLDTCLKFLLHSVLDPPRQRRASVTHDPKRVMSYDQPSRAFLG